MTNNTIQNVLVDNNRFAGIRINADQIGAENLRKWTELVKKLHQSAYEVYCQCECDGMTVDTTSVDMTPVFDAIRPILAEVGEVNDHKLVANLELATLMVSYAGKRANSDSPELQLVSSMLRNRQNELRKFEKTNGVSTETIEKLKADIEELEDQKTDLLAAPDNRIKAPTRTSFNAFRLDVEHRLARVIANQNAKTWEELEAEEAARKAERKAKNKARKQAKKQAESANK